MGIATAVAASGRRFVVNAHQLKSSEISKIIAATNTHSEVLDDHRLRTIAAISEQRKCRSLLRRIPTLQLPAALFRRLQQHFSSIPFKSVALYSMSQLCLDFTMVDLTCLTCTTYIRHIPSSSEPRSPADWPLRSRLAQTKNLPLPRLSRRPNVTSPWHLQVV